MGPQPLAAGNTKGIVNTRTRGVVAVMSEAVSTRGDVEWFAEMYEKLVANVEIFIKGKTDVVRKAALCLISEGHLLIEDVPGTGKTVLARALIASIDGTMRRIQFTPDLLPQDIIGVQIYSAASGEFEFHPGAAFCNVLLGDEINRASPKTQSALLEVMAEKQCTVDGMAYLVPRPFVVIATQNPVEHEGTYRLPEAQLDRFLMKVSIGYPSEEAEVEILGNRSIGRTPEQLSPVMTIADLLRMISIAQGIFVADSVRRYIVRLAHETRYPKNMPELRLGVSTRGAEALMMVAKAYAAAQGRVYVSVDDIKALASAVLIHRMILEPDAEQRGTTAESLLGSRLASLPVPQHAGV